MDSILEQFLGEARENLAFLDENLASLEDGDPDITNALFRAAHTLKGGAGLVGLDMIKNITHHAEDLLDGIKKGNIVYTEEMLDVLYDAFDEIVEMIDATEELGSIPEFDEDRVKEIANSVKNLMKKDDDEQEEDNSVDTELNLSSDEEIATLISSHNIPNYIKELPLDVPEITEDFLDKENFYLVDMDLDEQVCEFGNDPIYFAYLLGEDSIYSVLTTIYGKRKKILKNPQLWKSRFAMVVKSTKSSLEDSFYNIIDDVTLYPLSIKSLLYSDFESAHSEILDDFIVDFKESLESKNFEQFSESLSAVTKILNPETKEGFMLSRLEIMLPCFKFGEDMYTKLVSLVANELGIETKEPEKPVQKDLKVDDDKIKTVINSLEQQLSVLEFAKDDDTTLSRVKLHVKKTLLFIDREFDISNSDNKEDVTKKIQNHIDSISPKTQSVSEEIPKEVDKKIEEAKIPAKIQEKAPKKTPEKKAPIKKETHALKAVPKTVKIDQADIDGMMDIIGELLVMKNSLPYVANSISSQNVTQSKSDLMSKYEEINRVTEQLQDIVMGMRLLPLSYIFSRYPKLVRDMSKKLDKKIRFEEYGADTKLDKMMIEKIADPLVHIIRNSLDHGIEPSAQDRIDANKDPVGFIRIGAKSIGDKVEIIIEDDGRGIDMDKVLVKALGDGMVTEEQLSSMSEQEKLMLIFKPGLSTATEITDISGRGVGTDAVRKTIDELNGIIKLESKKGLGTKVIIELPVSVALNNVFCVKMNGNNYAIAMENVVETIKINTEDIQVANNKQYANLRGSIVPLVFEPRLLAEGKKSEEEQSIVIIQTQKFNYGLVVDEFVNQLNVVQKPLDGAIANHPMITGTSLLGNGEILFVLDTNNIVE